MENKVITKPVRLLYMPNESDTYVQAGPRAAFEHMLFEHTIADYQVFSFLVEAQKLATISDWTRKFLNVVNEFQPTVIFWQHIGKFPIADDLFTALKNIPCKPFLVYHEGDVFGKYRKRVMPSMKILTKNSDITFLPGLGQNAELFKNAGAKEIIYAPSFADTALFGKPWKPKKSDRNGVVLIGNNINRSNSTFENIPPLRFPGALQRENFVKQLYKRIGNQLKVFGKGWEKYPFSGGSIPFTSQESVLRQYLLSVNWDHFPDIPFSFSDRLPNTLLSGVAHATSYHPGFEYLFKNGEHLIYYHSIQEAVDVVDWMLCQPKNYLIELGIAGEEFVRQNLTVDKVFRKMVNIIIENMHVDSSQPSEKRL